MAEAPIPIKPGVFKCPDDFEPMCTTTEDTPFQSDDDDMELVLIRAPHDIDFSLLNGHVFPLNGSNELEIESEKGKNTFNLRCNEAQSHSELDNFNVLVGDNDKYAPISKTFTHHMEISRIINVPHMTFPERVDKDHKMPTDLKQRYISFGSDEPVVSVGEKQVLRQKKKQKKESTKLEIDEIPTAKPSKKEIKEKRKQLEESEESEIDEIPTAKPSTKVTIERRKQLMDKMELTLKYVEELPEVPPEVESKSTKERKHKVDEPKSKSKKSKSNNSHISDVLKSPKTEPKTPHKTPKKPKDSLKKVVQQVQEEDAALEHSREELIKLIMGDKVPKKGRVSKLKKDTSLLTFSQEF